MPRPAPAPGRVVYLLRQVCGALGEARNAAGLIHRDIKPSNIFAARRGGMGDVAKLLDFGLVLPTARSDAAHLSGEGQILGTPLFMSPEQATGGRELDGRSDIYSLGAVAYFLLTGRPPFEGEGGIGVMIVHARDPVVPPSLVRRGIPDDLEHVVLRCSVKDAAERFPDADSLEQALAECACARDWDQDRAARWWRDADRPPQTREAFSEQAGGPCKRSLILSDDPEGLRNGRHAVRAINSGRFLLTEVKLRVSGCPNSLAARRITSLDAASLDSPHRRSGRPSLSKPSALNRLRVLETHV